MKEFDPTILVVDDNVDFAENLAEMVEDFGFAAECLANGRDAEEFISNRRVDLSLVDINLPDMGGLDLLSILRRRCPESLCIIVTGNATIENAVQALNRGAFSYLVKGSEPGEYRSAIQNALNFLKSRSEVRQLREHNQTIIDSFPGRILVLDDAGRIVHTNRFPVLVERFFVLDLPAIVASDEPLSSLGLEPWQKRVASVFVNSRREEPVVIPEIAVASTDGSIRHYTIQLIPLRRETARHLVFILDISETVALREGIKKSERLATVGELAMTIAHEIRNPLTGISGAVQVLRGKMDPDGTDYQVCTEVVALVDRLNRTLDDLLLMARPLDLEFVESSVEDVIDSYLKLFGEDERYAGVTIETHFETADARFRGDPFRMQQAFANVLINAAQAMDGTGRIHVTLSREGRIVRLVVRDEGPGFPEDLGKLLEPFYTTKPAGTGLGLSITSRILEAHAGRLLLRNVTGGAEVTLEIPAVED